MDFKCVTFSGKPMVIFKVVDGKKVVEKHVTPE